MKSLYEGILGDVELNIDKMDKDIHDLNKFGYNFKFKQFTTLSIDKIAGVFSIKKLREITKNLKPLENGIKLSDKKWSSSKLNNEKLRLLLLWLDNIDLSQFNDVGKSNLSKSTIRELDAYIKDLMVKQDVFNNPNNVTTYVNNNHHRLCIFIYKIAGSYNNDAMMNIIYE